MTLENQVEKNPPDVSILEETNCKWKLELRGEICI